MHIQQLHQQEENGENSISLSPDENTPHTSLSMNPPTVMSTAPESPEPPEALTAVEISNDEFTHDDNNFNREPPRLQKLPEIEKLNLNTDPPPRLSLPEGPDVVTLAPRQLKAPDAQSAFDVRVSNNEENAGFNREMPNLPKAPTQTDLNINAMSPPEQPKPIDVNDSIDELGNVPAQDVLDVNKITPSRIDRGRPNISGIPPRKPSKPALPQSFVRHGDIAMQTTPEISPPPQMEQSPNVRRGLTDPVVRSKAPAQIVQPETNLDVLDVSATASHKAPEVMDSAPKLPGNIKVRDSSIRVPQPDTPVRVAQPARLSQAPKADELDIAIENPPEAATLSVSSGQEELDKAQPVIKPSDLVNLTVADGQNDEAQDLPSAEQHDPEVSVSSGHFYLRSTDDRDGDVDMFYNLNAGQAYPMQNLSLSVDDEMLNNILNTSYDNSRGSYTRGTIVDSHHLPREFLGARVNPERSRHQWASGLSTDFIQYVAGRYSTMDSGKDFCINNLSLKNGGDTPSHASHENGLDVDISYPSSSNDCSSPIDYFEDWEDLAEGDPEFLKRNWDFLKFMLVDDEVRERITIIFTDKNFMKSLCNWAKDNGKEQSDIETVINKLYHQRGHHHHYHIRLVCNHQNTGCTPQNSYTNGSKKVNPKTCK